DMHDADKQITARTKIVSITQASNVLGVVNPIKQIAALAHAQHAVLLVDGAQSVPHMPIDVQQLDADFFVFSGHKMMGPTGIGVLYGKRDLLAHIPPAQFGGEMVTTVSQNDAHFQPLPWRFEAGTPNIAGAIGLGAAIDYLLTLDMVKVAKYEQQLTQYALESLHKIDAITVYGADDV
ncbi:aminotransferase class V-fold PLP-dependent enzyme, partial [Pseudomonas stutzeri]|nr:aminotransferase class V-fold PLP-dependent enzyme [Stutzerimonas stutzeri]